MLYSTILYSEYRCVVIIFPVRKPPPRATIIRNCDGARWHARAHARANSECPPSSPSHTPLFTPDAPIDLHIQWPTRRPLWQSACQSAWFILFLPILPMTKQSYTLTTPRQPKQRLSQTPRFSDSLDSQILGATNRTRLSI